MTIVSEVLSNIEAAARQDEPFPHLVVSDVFPRETYDGLVKAAANSGEFREVIYPGAGERKAQVNTGLAIVESVDSALRPLWDVGTSKEFADIVFAKFDDVIPKWKKKHVVKGSYTSVSALYQDRSGYEIRPHPDVREKIITYLFYLPPYNVVTDVGAGTFLCTPKPGKKVERSWLNKKIRSFVGKPPNKYEWELFDLQEVKFEPNKLLVFAPSSTSYHAVRFEKQDVLPTRLIYRGFIRIGEKEKNWLRFS